MRWESGLSEDPVLENAVGEAAGVVRTQLAGEEAHLAVAFISPHHAAAYEQLPDLISAEFPGSLFIGCSAEGVIGAGHEVEQRAAFSLTAAALPGVALRPLELDAEKLPEDREDVQAWQALVGAPATEDLHFVLLVDPVTFDAAALVEGLDAAYPRSCKIGGLSSGGTRERTGSLFLQSRLRRSGAVGVALSGNIAVEAIVAQGCRPIGTPRIITQCQGNVVLELDGRPPLLVVRELYEKLPERDRKLLQTSLFAGLEMKSGEVQFRPGNLLARNIIGLDPQVGAIAIGAVPNQWQVMQFLLRDAQTATEDLTRLLDLRRGSPMPSGALLFSCLGRGIHLFGEADHDTKLFREKLGPVPLGGFFCNGEIGPVGASTFLHGYTSAFALFREAHPPVR